MERNKRQDWTDVLRDRLQDAQLPLDDGWGASAAVPGRARRAWWPLALAGATAAILAAVLLLRPQPEPEPTRLVRTDLPTTVIPDTTAVEEIPGQAGDDIKLAGDDKKLAAEEEILRPAQDDKKGAGDEKILRRAQDDKKTANVIPDSPAIIPDPPTVIPDPIGNLPLLAQNDQNTPADTTTVEEILRQAQDDTKLAMDDTKLAMDDKKIASDDRKDDGAVKPQTGITLADLEPFPEDPEPSRRERQARRISLRVQAGFAGTSLSNGIGSVNTIKTEKVPGKWILNDVHPTGANVGPDYTDNPGTINNPGASSGQGGILWYYRPEYSVMKSVTVPVRKAPVFPISFGVSAALPLSRSWVLTAGLDYTQRDGYRVFNYNPQSLTLHYLGIPVDIHYYFNPESRWRFYLGAGLHAGKCIAATGGEPLQDPVLFSGNVMVGTDIRLFPGVRLYLAPALSGFFNQSAYLNTWDSKAYFQMRAGLSFDLK